MGTLYVVATPIGNLEDITLRALRVLKEVAVVFCEDARYTKRLLDHFEITTPTMTLFEHSGMGTLQKVYELLVQGKDVAYVTDAGTPGVSDPGGKLIDYLLNREASSTLFQENSKFEILNSKQIPNSKFETSESNPISIVPIPGASALTAALSVAGINLERFVFMGFPPVKNKRNKYFAEVVASEYPVVFYESTYRLIKSLEQLAEQQHEIEVIVAGELTKKFEKIYRGRIGEVLSELKGADTRGEYVVIVNKK